MTSNARITFSGEFKHETAQLVLDKDHTLIEETKAMNVGKSTMDNLVRGLKLQRSVQSQSFFYNF
jgi:hypothetical protein